MGIVVLGAVFVDIKGYPLSAYIPGGRNAGRIEQVHGGVSRNVVEDIANVELRPTFVSLVDDTGMGQDVINKLENHKVNTKYIQRVPDGMGTWLAIFDNDGDVDCTGSAPFISSSKLVNAYHQLAPSAVRMACSCICSLPKLGSTATTSWPCSFMRRRITVRVWASCSCVGSCCRAFTACSIFSLPFRPLSLG